MDFIYYIIDFIIHIDKHMLELVQAYGTMVYVFLFLIIFCETGLVVTPFLPGDSLLFACGALAGSGYLSYPLLWCLILAAAITGDFVNYRIGSYIGPQVFSKDYRLLKRKHLLQAHEFYERHGGKAIILARFVPIVRTFAPFVAGVASMNPKRFLFFNITGALGWVTLFLTLGYFFGTLPFVQNNFTLIALGIIVISVMPMVVEFVRAWLRKRKGEGMEAPGNETAAKDNAGQKTE